MSKENLKDEISELKKEILDNVQRCWKCRMCAPMCPTYEGWYTQSSAGRMMSINAYFNHGYGDRKTLSEMLYSCATCRRCQVRCRALSTDSLPAETILKARELLIKMAKAEGGK